MTTHAEEPVICVATMDFQFRSLCSFIDLMRLSDKYHRINFVDMTLLPYARNRLVKMTYEQYPDFTHIIFVDDDMCGYLAEHFDALIAADKDIISGLVTTRRPPYQMVNSFPSMPPADIIENIENETVLQSDLVGMAFTCIKREVFDQTGEQLVEGQSDTDGDIIWFTMDRSPRRTLESEIADFIDDRQTFTEENIYQAITMGQNAHLGTTLIGEDCAFIRRAKNLGFSSHVHMGVIISHLGSKVCNVKDSIKYRVEREIAHNEGLSENQSRIIID